MYEYTVPIGPKNFGMIVLRYYRHLAGAKCTDDGVRLSMILGWCLEWVSSVGQAYCVVSRAKLQSFDSLWHRSRIRYLNEKNSRILTNFPKLKNS